MFWFFDSSLDGKMKRSCYGNKTTIPTTLLRGCIAMDNKDLCVEVPEMKSPQRWGQNEPYACICQKQLDIQLCKMYKRLKRMFIICITIMIIIILLLLWLISTWLTTGTSYPWSHEEIINNNKSNKLLCILREENTHAPHPPHTQCTIHSWMKNTRYHFFYFKWIYRCKSAFLTIIFLYSSIVHNITKGCYLIMYCCISEVTIVLSNVIQQ